MMYNSIFIYRSFHCSTGSKNACLLMCMYEEYIFVEKALSAMAQMRSYVVTV